MAVKPARRLRESFRFAWEGLSYAYRTQQNFRIHLVIAILAVILVGLFYPDGKDLAIVVLTIMTVLGAELTNTALETLVDLISPDYHPLAKRVKDLAAGVVLVMALGAVIIGILLILW
jgi:diacylglycerol kinase